MQNELKQNEITYDENWQTVSTPEYAHTVSLNEEDSTPENEVAIIQKPKKKRDSPIQLLIIIQLVICVLIALFAYTVKNIGGNFYTNIRDWYYSNLNSTLVVENNAEVDFTNILKNSTADEV